MKFSESLKKNRDFQHVYRNGTSLANRFFVMYVLENQLGKNRIGISVSKKVGNSVVRHRVTRLVRESYRLNEETFARGMDLVVIARVSAKGITFRQTEKALLHLAGLHRITAADRESDLARNAAADRESDVARSAAADRKPDVACREAGGQTRREE